jgi:hypothetical protein
MAGSTIDSSQDGLTETSRFDHLLAQLSHALSAFLIMEQYDEAGQAGVSPRIGDDAESGPGARVWY